MLPVRAAPRPFPGLSPALALLALACSASPGPGPAQRAWIEPGVGLYVDASLPTPPPADGRGVLVAPAASWLDADLEPLRSVAELVFYDPRGRGRSSSLPEGTRASLDEDVRDLELLRLQLGLERLSLLGWSRQAAIVVRYALRYPERVSCLVLVDPLPPVRDPFWLSYLADIEQHADPEPFRELDAMRASGLKDEDPAAFCRAQRDVFVRTFTHDPGALARMKSDPCRPPNLDPDESARLGQEILAELGDWDWRKELEGLPVPVLLVHGVEDWMPLGGSVEYAAHLPDARVVPIEGSGHMPWLERPDEFFAAVREFLAGVWPEPARRP